MGGWGISWIKFQPNLMQSESMHCHVCHPKRDSYHDGVSAFATVLDGFFEWLRGSRKPWPEPARLSSERLAYLWPGKQM